MTVLSPGFADPVTESQAAFRAVLDALSRPGTIHRLAAPAEPPAPLGRAAAAVLLTLADNETAVFLGAGAEPARPWVAFHCGAPEAPAARAAFLMCLTPPDWSTVPAGTDEEPEAGATVILEVAALGEGGAFELAGPGPAAPTAFHAALPPGFAAAWDGNRARFPRGFDLILCCGDRLAALPRTTLVREAR